jgi:hypothetical protein
MDGQKWNEAVARESVVKISGWPTEEASPFSV